MQLSKSVAGAGLAIVSDYEENIYREIEKEMERDTLSKRDHWWKWRLDVPMKTFIPKIDSGFINLSYVITNYDVDAK